LSIALELLVNQKFFLRLLAFFKYYSQKKAICQAFFTCSMREGLTTPNFSLKRNPLSQVKGESHKILLGSSKPVSGVFLIKTSTGKIFSKSSVVSGTITTELSYLFRSF
jgi:hypothetical protein